MNAASQSENKNIVFSLRGVRYLYNGRHLALDGIDLDIQCGESVVLLGANGCGKSTLLKLLDGIYAPTSGTMRVLDRDVKAVAEGYDAFQFHREVGLVFQDPDIQLFSATIFDDVAFGPLQMGLSQHEVKARCEEALAQMEIAHLATRAPFELSGGEKKRAAIASVLSLHPDIILLDEPTASLDPRSKWLLVNLIRQLLQYPHTLQYPHSGSNNERSEVTYQPASQAHLEYLSNPKKSSDFTPGATGKTIITATHELEIVPIIAQRVILLGEERRVLADGPPEQILRDHDLLVRANLIHPKLHQWSYFPSQNEDALASKTNLAPTRGIDQ